MADQTLDLSDEELEFELEAEAKAKAAARLRLEAESSDEPVGPSQGPQTFGSFLGVEGDSTLDAPSEPDEFGHLYERGASKEAVNFFGPAALEIGGAIALPEFVGPYKMAKNAGILSKLLGYAKNAVAPTLGAETGRIVSRLTGMKPPLSETEDGQMGELKKMGTDFALNATIPALLNGLSGGVAKTGDVLEDKALGFGKSDFKTSARGSSGTMRSQAITGGSPESRLKTSLDNVKQTIPIFDKLSPRETFVTVAQQADSFGDDLVNALTKADKVRVERGIAFRPELTKTKEFISGLAESPEEKLKLLREAEEIFNMNPSAEVAEQLAQLGEKPFDGSLASLQRLKRIYAKGQYLQGGQGKDSFARAIADDVRRTIEEAVDGLGLPNQDLGIIKSLNGKIHDREAILPGLARALVQTEGSAASDVLHQFGSTGKAGSPFVLGGALLGKPKLGAGLATLATLGLGTRAGKVGFSQLFKGADALIPAADSPLVRGLPSAARSALGGATESIPQQNEQAAPLAGKPKPIGIFSQGATASPNSTATPAATQPSLGIFKPNMPFPQGLPRDTSQWSEQAIGQLGADAAQRAEAPVVQGLSMHLLKALRAGDKRKAEKIVYDLSRLVPDLFEPGRGVNNKLWHPEDQATYMAELDSLQRKGGVSSSFLAQQRDSFLDPNDGRILDLMPETGIGGQQPNNRVNFNIPPQEVMGELKPRDYPY